MRISGANDCNIKNDLKDNFINEESCRKYLSQIRWKKNIGCPHCNNIKVYEYKNGKLYKCAKCRKQFSVKVGTIFEDSKVPLKHWLNAIYLLISNKNGTSSMQLSRDIGVTQKTAWLMLDRIRLALRIKSQDEINELQKKKKQDPMMKHINQPFPKVLKRLTNVDRKTIKISTRNIEVKTTKNETTNFNRPSQDFDPETD